MIQPKVHDRTATGRLVQLCLWASKLVNKIFFKITASLQALILPQVSVYQMRVYAVTVVQVLSSDLMLLTIAKTMQVYYEVSNFLLLLAVGGILPFVRALHQLWFYIPCPPMASVISNITLVVAFVVLLLLGIGTYFSVGGWLVFTYIMTIWPWLVLMSMVSRLYVEQQVGQSPLSPVKELPILGIMSALAMSLSLMAAKGISIADCLIVSCLDPILAALLASAFLGSARRKLHFRNVKVYLVLFLLVAVYRLGEQGPGVSPTAPPSYHHAIFVGARLLFVARSVFVKRAYANFNTGTKPPPQPQENGLLFYSHERPQKNRFTRFPAPALFTLDVIFDSGLRDSDFHAMGPLGTQDLMILTEGTYLLPVAALMSWMNEFDTLQNGVSSLVEGQSLSATIAANYLNQSDTSAVAAATCVCCPTAVTSTSTDTDNQGLSDFANAMLPLLIILFCATVLARPLGAAVTMFDRGSSVHAWKYQPIIIATPFFLADILFLNKDLSKFQVIVVLVTSAVLAHYRSDLWTFFKRRYLLLCTQELHYFQPAVVRQLQRNTLIEFLNSTSTDDYGMLLLETAIRHGNNIRELARDTNVVVWDAAPTATAAWKLAFSLVKKSLHRQKLLARMKEKEVRDSERFVAGIVLEIIDTAVDIAAGHGARLRLAGALAAVFNKRRAIRTLAARAQNRRLLRHKRRNGQLAHAPAHLATAGGTIRSLLDLPDATKLQPRNSPMLGTGALLDAQHSKLLSLTATSQMQNPSRLTMPGELSFDPELGESSFWQDVPRGIFWDADSRDLVGSLVLAFGDSRRGQLGQEDGSSHTRAPGTQIMPIEELRGCDPVQVEAAGVTSFVLSARGQIWGFGSNRSMELGMRKEMAQVNAPQRVKSLRSNRIVQVAGSCASSGQAHTLVLTGAGEVYSFGTSGCGALGHGRQTRQTAPLLVQLTTQVLVRRICVGASHSMLLTDEGRLYAMGDNRQGQLGLGRHTGQLNASEPTLLGGIMESERVSLLACGDDHTLAVTEGGTFYAWGANANGQLGLSRIDDQASPQVVLELQGVGVSSLACGSRHSLVVADSGTQVWAFGSNVQGQLGIGNSNAAEGFQMPYPTLIQTMTKRPGMVIKQVAAASCHSLAVTQAGEVYAWGDNKYGQLGFPTAESALAASQADAPRRANGAVPAPRGVQQVWLPALVSALRMSKVQAVSTADMHTLVLVK